VKKLGNDTIVLLLRTDGAVDRLGVKQKNVNHVSVPYSSFQPATDTESDTNTDSTISKDRVYCPPTTDVLSAKTTDGIEYNGVTYEIYGDPEPWTDRKGVIHHVMFFVRKARG
jgi:hypothetical protein